MEINIEDLTTKDLMGTGVFDNIMEASQVRLDREFAKNRLKGPEYAKVYLGSFEASLMNSIQFLLTRQEADKKAELLVAQTKKTDKESLLMDEQILIAKEELKIKKQDLLIRAEELRIKQQELLIAIEKLKLTEVQVWVERAKVSDDVTITTPPKVLSGLMGGQIRKIDNEGLLLAQKVITEQAQTKGSTIAHPLYSNMEATARSPLAIAEYVKFKKWVYTSSKTKDLFDTDFGGDWCTEFPELCSIWGIIDPDNPPDYWDPDPTDPTDPDVPSGTIPDYTPPAIVPLPPMPTDWVPIEGVLGRQMDLYKKQTDGFDRDAEQKLSKIYVDAWNVQRGTDDAFPSCGSGLENMDIASILNVARKGIGVEHYTVPGGTYPDGSLWKETPFPGGGTGVRPTCPVNAEEDAQNAISLREFKRVKIAELTASAKVPKP